MSTKETVKRYLLFIISLFFIGFGIALTKHGELGVTPISSVANAVSLKFAFLSFGMWIAGLIPNDSYAMQLVLVFAGIIVLAFGISLSVIANVILNAGEAFVKALTDTVKKDFGNTKIAFDVSRVALLIVLSLFFFRWEVGGRT